MDLFREVFDVLSRNRMRSCLTALSVGWGIFMLVILLAAGVGLRRGVEHDFRDDATNSIWMYAGETSIPYAGRPPGRSVRLTNQDLETIAANVPVVERITGRFHIGGEHEVVYKDRSELLSLRAVHPDHQYLERSIVTQGRFLNDLDMARRRKVAVVGEEVVEALFRRTSPIGERLAIAGQNYVVVGVFRDEGSRAERRRVYLPMSTAQAAFRGRDRLHQIMFTVGGATAAESEATTDRLQQLMARRHGYDPADKRATRIENNLANFQRLMDIFDWLEVFVWLVGLGTLASGVVGVSNIMLISVRERTLEIGVRKALGATPGSIVAQVLLEASALTAAAGYAGLVVAVALVEAVRTHLPDNPFVRNPTVDFSVALSALAILLVAGLSAGLAPATRAARVKPVVAMRGG